MEYSVILTDTEVLLKLSDPGVSFIKLDGVALNMAVEIAKLALDSGYFAIIVPEIVEG